MIDELTKRRRRQEDEEFFRKQFRSVWEYLGPEGEDAIEQAAKEAADAEEEAREDEA